MSSLSVSDAWTVTAEQLRRDGRLFLPIALLLIGVPSAVLQLFVSQELVIAALKAREFPPVFLLAVPTAILSLYGSLALTAMTLIARVSVGEALGVAARRFAIAFIARLILGLAFALTAVFALAAAAAASPPLGMFLLLVVGAGIFFVYVRFIFIEPVTIDGPLGPLGALRRSWQLTASSVWRLLGFLLVLGIGSLVLSLVADIIGGLLALLLQNGLGLPAAAAVVAVLLPALASALISTVYAPIVANIYRQLVPANL